MNRNDRDMFRNAANGIDPYGGTGSYVGGRSHDDQERYAVHGHAQHEHERWHEHGQWPDARADRDRDLRPERGPRVEPRMEPRFDAREREELERWHDPTWRGRDESRDFWGYPRGGYPRGRSLGDRIGDLFRGEDREDYERSYRARHPHPHETIWEKVRDAFVGKGPKNYARSDERIREDVCERLTYHPYIDASDVEVTVASGEVTLAGTVEDRRAKRLAEDVVDDVRGVRDIHNRITIKPR